MDDENIRYLMQKPLSGDEVMTICDNDANLIPYHDICKLDDLDDLFKGYDAAIILYEKEAFNGHYVAVSRDRKKRTITFFDPYGYHMDSERKWFTKRSRQMLNEDHAYLTDLIKKYCKENHYKFIENHYKFQRDRHDMNIATCGRWSAWFIHCHKTPKQLWDSFMKYPKDHSLDYYIVTLTSNLI